ncbi:borneol dehydrogenase, mitochondrial-like [Rosa rugosa]|uniref:borneol dehydrogenase, mitochondrial-like n=1 Tax=Rosa rugosa TaxID=74645 RepID=UPI002B407A8A|nr:borneol dehydrogenase, mitochondrial-like [Rosa rugosa]
MMSFPLLSAAARRLEGKVAVITGEASGIGESTARLFSRHGAKVVIADVQDDLGQSVCRDLNPSTTTFIHCDVTNEKDFENAVNRAITKYGKLDIMFNNAGISDVVNPNILDNNEADFEQVLGVNLVGVFLGIKHAARAMMGARKGTIINLASVCSIIGGGASHAYMSSKHGVEGLTKNTALELGKYGIRVNCVSPYLVETSLTKKFFKFDDEGVGGAYSNLNGAVPKAEDVAEAVLYLGSDESKYVSGHNLIVDGGYTITNSRFCMFEQS